MPAVYASGTGITRRSRLLCDDPHDRRVAPAPPFGPTSAPGMHVALGHDAAERRGDPQVPFHVADRSQRLTGRFDVLLRGRDLTLIGLHGFLRQDHVVAGDHARRRGRRFQLLVGARARLRLRADGRELRLRALQLRLRLGLSARRVRAPRARPVVRPRGPATRDRRAIVFTNPVTREYSATV